jgi:hypothetical protein
MELVGILHGQFVYFIAIRYAEFSFGILNFNFVYFMVIWYIAAVLV